MTENQFMHGRIPLKPLAWKNKSLVDANEIVIDYGREDSNYHIYIAPSSSSNFGDNLIDLSNKMIEEVSKNVKVDSSNFVINIGGENEEVEADLQEEFLRIYRRYVYPANYETEFNYNDYKNDIADPDTRHDVLLRDTAGHVIAPVTVASNIYFDNGETLAMKLGAISSGVKYTTIIAEHNNQHDFKFKLPSAEYDENDIAVLVRKNGVNNGYVSNDQYLITSTSDIDQDTNLPYYNLYLNDTLDPGDEVDILFLNSNTRYINYRYADGSDIALNSIPTNRLNSVSYTYGNGDPNYIASATSVYNLYHDFVNTIDKISDTSHIWAEDYSAQDSHIDIITSHVLADKTFFIMDILLRTDKDPEDLKLHLFTDNSMQEADEGYSILDFNTGNKLIRPLKQGTIVKLVWKNDGNVYVLTPPPNIVYRYIAKDQETKISYDELNYYHGAKINVYKNGLKLFENFDYFNDSIESYIKLYIPTNANDQITFEVVQ